MERGMNINRVSENCVSGNQHHFIVTLIGLECIIRQLVSSLERRGAATTRIYIFIHQPHSF